MQGATQRDIIENENYFQNGKKMKRESYQTKQKDLIRKTVMKMKGDFSVKELFGVVSKADETVGLTTIYRLINKMVESGELNTIIGKDGATRYHFEKECEAGGHCLLKCEECGKIIHEDCEVVEEMLTHFANEHKFAINKNEIVVYGICKRCRK